MCMFDPRNRFSYTNVSLLCAIILLRTQVVINAALYYMHNFYEVFSPETVKPVMVSIASLYLACKTEDFSRKLSLLISVAYSVFKKNAPAESSSTFRRIVQNIHALEGTILMVVGFQKMDVKHPHVILINVLRQNDFPKQVSHTSYFVCTHILHFTTLLLRHSMEAIAATSLYVAAKWNNYDIKSEDGEWYRLFSRELTLEEIRKMADEFTQAFQACDVKIKNQVKNTLKMNFNRHHAREDSVMQARRANESGRVYNRPEKRPHESHNVLNHQQQHVKDMLSSGGGVFSTNGQQLAVSSGVYDDTRSRMKVPRVCSPKSQPPPQIHSQSAFPVATHPDSASALKREEAPKHPDSVGGSYPSVASRSSTTSNARNDLSSIF
ncbi:unnamed protein product [Hydatigera taeniaeformis]|uniref:Cyclin N-terminal domain-containing protein n=1 Tax=Hydatigena taeniaeformis TaxID=6205 RepID=A0A0R3X7Z2_HYDTA|nr:unnamed protein product [Hydatigera taeniaeformis]